MRRRYGSHEAQVYAQFGADKFRQPTGPGGIGLPPVDFPDIPSETVPWTEEYMAGAPAAPYGWHPGDAAAGGWSHGPSWYGQDNNDAEMAPLDEAAEMALLNEVVTEEMEEIAVAPPVAEAAPAPFSTGRDWFYVAVGAAGALALNAMWGGAQGMRAHDDYDYGW